MIKLKVVENYTDYLHKLDGKGDVFVFRGQANANFILIPSSLRAEQKISANKEMLEFVSQMQETFNFDELTCIEIAQHFFLPTRMLDFSYSYDVALFFACCDPKGRYKDQDGKVFIFNKSKYERYLREHNCKSSQMIKINKFLYEWLESFLADKKHSHYDIDLPLFVDATEEFDRLHMQKGLFLLWGKSSDSLEKIFSDEKINYDDFIEEIIIKKEAKEMILASLKEKHITEDTIYMNISLIRQMVDNIKKGRGQN